MVTTMAYTVGKYGNTVTKYSSMVIIRAILVGKYVNTFAIRANAVGKYGNVVAIRA